MPDDAMGSPAAERERSDPGIGDGTDHADGDRTGSADSDRTNRDRTDPAEVPAKAADPGADVPTAQSAFADAEPGEWGTPEGRRMIRLLWDPPPPATRGPRQRLSLDDVVSAAMRLAGRDGAEAVSMRKVAAELGVGVMSLYTYVPGRDELFELMVDRAWAIRRHADPTLGWRAQVASIAEEAWQMYQAYPWLVMTNEWRTPLGPNVLDAQEDLYRALCLSGLKPDQVSRAASLVEGHVSALARAAIVDTRLAAQSGVSADSYWNSRASFWGTYYERSRFPAMTSLWEQGAFDQELGTLDEMRFGLDLILDGLEALASG